MQDLQAYSHMPALWLLAFIECFGVPSMRGTQVARGGGNDSWLGHVVPCLIVTGDVI